MYDIINVLLTIEYFYLTVCNNSIVFNSIFSGLQPTVLPFMDHYPNAEAEIKKSLGGYDALIWNTKFRLTGELLDLAGTITMNVACNMHATVKHTRTHAHTNTQKHTPFHGFALSHAQIDISSHYYVTMTQHAGFVCL